MIAPTSEEYRASVARVMSGKIDGTIFNGTLDHARVVIEEAFKAADSRVRVLANRLSPACYSSSEVISAAVGFLQNPEAHLDVLVERPEEGALSSRFLLEVMQAGGTRVRALSVPEELQTSYTFNFLTVDEAAYRFEEDRTKPIAIVGGGESAKPTVKHLTQLYDRLFAVSRPLQLTLEPA